MLSPLKLAPDHDRFQVETSMGHATNLQNYLPAGTTPRLEGHVVRHLIRRSESSVASN